MTAIEMLDHRVKLRDISSCVVVARNNFATRMVAACAVLGGEIALLQITRRQRSPDSKNVMSDDVVDLREQ